MIKSQNERLQISKFVIVHLLLALLNLKLVCKPRGTLTDEKDGHTFLSTKRSGSYPKKINK